MTDTAQSLLEEALNLSVRARGIDEVQRRQSMLDASKDPKGWKESGAFARYVERHNCQCEPWERLSSANRTPQLWVNDQYDRDLYEWEQRTRKFMRSALEGHQCTCSKPPQNYSFRVTRPDLLPNGPPWTA